MGGLDWILIAIYLLIMLGIGFTSMKKVKTNEDYALAGRSVGNFWVILSLFASWTGLSGLFGTPQYVYQYGIAGWWWWVTFPLGVFIMGMTMAKLLRKRMYTTLSDTVDPLHSSPAIRIVSSLVTVWNYLAWTAGQVAGIILVITTFTNSQRHHRCHHCLYYYCYIHCPWRPSSRALYRLLPIGAVPFSYRSCHSCGHSFQI